MGWENDIHLYFLPDILTIINVIYFICQLQAFELFYYAFVYIFNPNHIHGLIVTYKHFKQFYN